MATIVDVAEYAGVSVATVSRMMNSPDVVSEKTKKKIHKAMQELHYQPNAMARALQQKKSNIIGLVLPYINYAFFSELTDAVHRVFPLTEVHYLHRILHLHEETILTASCPYIPAHTYDSVHHFLHMPQTDPYL